MLVKLPAVTPIDSRTRLCHVRQIAEPEISVDCTVVPWVHGKEEGCRLLDTEGNTIACVLATKPRSWELGNDTPVLIARMTSVDAAALDLTSGSWWQHPRVTAQSAVDRANEARASWDGAFRFAEENVDAGMVGLRKPQLGALHAIHAHWSTSSDTVSIVMPTGTGKTETMLSTLVSMGCHRVLVIVPSDALRTQISEKFQTLGLLKKPGNVVLADTAQRPVVGTLLSRPKSVDEVDAVFSQCNVIVSTSQLAAQCLPEVRARMASLCSHLFIDEAHHAEAATWKVFREHFRACRVLQFTATPFREDGQKIDGKLAYVYPLRKAQAEDYFRPIRFRAVNDFNALQGDRLIATAALEELDDDATGKHIVMARVSGVDRAHAIHQLYRSMGRYESVLLHSRLSAKERALSKQKLLDGTARVVVCVDMLGEGFDLPELKIAAFHDIRKSLAVTLQLAGRFTRARSDLGNAVFIANVALIDVRDELRTLYAQDPDWNALLPAISTAAIEEEVASQEFFEGFGNVFTEIPLKDLRPAASMVVYKTTCTNWSPLKFKRGFRGLSSRDKLYHSLNEVENTLVILAVTEQGVRWSDVESIRETTWELFIAVWDRANALLFLHGSGISGEYKDIAKALCGEDAQLVVAPAVFRTFDGIKRLTLTNVGLNEHLGRQVRYVNRMGSDVEARIGQAARRGAKRAVLAGKGFDQGQRVSVGAAKRGRVWSNLRLRVDTFAAWAKSLGKKIADESIDPDQVLKGTLKPQSIGAVPEKFAIAADWPKEILERPEHVSTFHGVGIREKTGTDVDVELLERDLVGPIQLRVFSEDWTCVVQLEFLNVENGFDFKFTHVGGAALQIRLGATNEPIEEFFTRYPPIVWFADGSSLEGCEYTEMPTDELSPYDADRFQVIDWSGVDISAESQGEERRAGTIQGKVIELLQGNPDYAVIFDDDGAGEAADIVAIKPVVVDGRTHIDVELYHLKYTSGRPGARVDDLYVVCGQAQRSTCWLLNHDRRTDLFTHLLKRNDQRTARGASSRFERGDMTQLLKLKELSRAVDVKLQVYVVQPGLSRAVASQSQKILLSVTERYLTDTYAVPFAVMCSA
jgi:superfamily II DNA or RNA helicase